MKRDIKGIIVFVLKWWFLLTVVIFTLYPVVYTLLGSLRTHRELMLGGSFLPESWQFSNYYHAFTSANFAQYTLNSVILAVSVTLLAVVTSSLAGYVLARRDIPGKKLILGMYLAFMFISLGSVTLLPLFNLFNSLGMTGNLSAIVLVMTGGQTVNVFLIMGFIRTVPKEIDEAATMDGCSPFQIYYKIILPMIRPILAVVILFSFRSAWNAYITPLVFSIGNSSLRTLTVGIVQLRYSANAAAEWHIMLAGASIALIPILVIYAFTHKQFIGGLSAGAVKG